MSCAVVARAIVRQRRGVAGVVSGTSTFAGASSSVRRLPAFALPGPTSEPLPTASLTLHSLLGSVRPTNIVTARTEIHVHNPTAENLPDMSRLAALSLAPLSQLPAEAPSHSKDDIFTGLAVPDPDLSKAPKTPAQLKTEAEAFWKVKDNSPERRNIMLSKLTHQHYRICIPIAESDLIEEKMKLQTQWRLRTNQLVGCDGGMGQIPVCADWLFIAFTGLEALFLFINLWTTAPFVFEKAMPYHLSYTGLCLGWWASSVYRN